MRSRNLKPEFFRDPLIAGLSPAARWVYQGLWVVADDYGTAPADALQLHADLFVRWPEMSVEVVDDALLELLAANRITMHRTPNGDRFAVILSWGKHQRPSHPGKFRYPAEGERVMAKGVTETRTPPAKARAPKGKPAKSAIPGFREVLAAPSGGLPKEVCDQFFESWVAQVGAIDYGRFRKAILPLFQVADPPSPWLMLEAIRLFTHYRTTLSDRERGFAGIDRFVADSARWLSLGAQPLQHPDGSLTERGELVSQ